MKDFFQFRGLTEAKRTPAKTKGAKKPVKKGWSTEPPKGNAKITSLFNKVIDPEKKLGEGILKNAGDDLTTFYGIDAIDDGDWGFTVDVDEVEEEFGSKYIEDGEIDEYAIEKNPRVFKKFKQMFMDNYIDQQWHNVRRDMRSSISDAHVLSSENTAKPLDITIGEAGGYFTTGGYEITYIYIGKVDADDPDIVLCSDKFVKPTDVAKVVERLLFDGHKSVRGIKI